MALVMSVVNEVINFLKSANNKLVNRKKFRGAKRLRKQDGRHRSESGEKRRKDSEHRQKKNVPYSCKMSKSRQENG